jgi:hypothetical protein
MDWRRGNRSAGRLADLTAVWSVVTKVLNSGSRLVVQSDDRSDDWTAGSSGAR